MKSLVVYYSKSGNTRLVGNEIAKELNAEYEELVDLKKRSGVVGFITAATDSIGRKLTTIEPIQKKPADYQMIVVGTPSWGNNMASAVRTFLTENNLTDKKVHFFCTAGADAGKSFEEMEKLISGNTQHNKMTVISSEIKSGKYKEKVKEFVGQIKG
ncbi:MAG: hypothetical protein MJB14_01305 [Spirochaetes bacterium]|nr:hypothetical protein [Spirochaetota bacterium]